MRDGGGEKEERKSSSEESERAKEGARDGNKSVSGLKLNSAVRFSTVSGNPPLPPSFRRSDGSVQIYI